MTGEEDVTGEEEAADATVDWHLHDRIGNSTHIIDNDGTQISFIAMPLPLALFTSQLWAIVIVCTTALVMTSPD